MMNMEITKYRRRLNNTIHALQQGKLTIGFLGGSITDGRSRHNWPYPVVNWFAEKFPPLNLYVENAAIGATGSDLAVFRVQRDILNRDCDLVFVEYAVNDWEVSAERRNRTREGLIRKLLDGGGRDVVLIYTYQQEMYRYMINGEMPDSIAEFERLAEYYGIGSVWVGLHALGEVQKGRMRWEEWLPDGLHPQYRGSYSYASCIMKYLEKELSDLNAANGEGEYKMPVPLYGDNWQNTYILPFSSVKCEGPWKLARSVDNVWMDHILTTSAPGAKLTFEFEGRGLFLGFDFGKTSSEFLYRLDGGEWMTSRRDRPSWCGDRGWFRSMVLFEDIPCTEHSIEMVVIHGDRPDCTGTDFSLALIGVIL